MPRLYGPEHTIYVIVSVLVAIISCVCAKLFIKTDRSKGIFMRCAGGILFLIILLNRIALVFEYGDIDWKELLTDSICSTSSYVLGLALLFGKKDNCILHFVWFISLAGGTITTFYSNFIGQHPSFLYLPTILGMMHHTVSAIIVILMLILKYVNISYKKWYYTLWGFTSYLSYGAFLMCVLDIGNPFYMVEPAIDNTPFTVWVLIPIYVVVYSLILLGVEIIRKRKKELIS
ncbi:MAG: hypothetical protein IKJ30_03215 [Bacilli bacterium]|nr:hypothetical protein [Bacilli bacterium]